MKLAARVKALERCTGVYDHGPVILFAPSHLSQEQALAANEARYGPITREPFFIALVGPDE